MCKIFDKSIGENNISIPTHFYKAIQIFSDSIKHSTGYIILHIKLFIPQRFGRYNASNII